MALSDRVREAIETSKKSKADIARACEVTNAAVTHWISGGTKSMKADTALALEEATGYRARWILYGKGTKKLGEVYWPFGIEIARYIALSDKDRGYVEGRLEAAIEHCEQGGLPSPEEAERELAQKLERQVTKRKGTRKKSQ